MKITVLGTGTWGTALAWLLNCNGHEVTVWSRNAQLMKTLVKKRIHPKLKNFSIPHNIIYEEDLEKAISEAELIVESVTSAGVREVFAKAASLTKIHCPVVITSKGIEQKSDLLLVEVLLDIFGKEFKPYIGILSGPSLAEDVIQKHPTSLVASSYSSQTIALICQAFNNPYFRVYPNADIMGIAFGGAMKNIIAIACGISDGLGYGDNAKAALLTRGLHEIRKLGVTKNAQADTLNGLSGLGDLCVTCLSKFSRNYTFGYLLAKGLTPKEAKEKIGMVVEGAYTCVSAKDLAEKHNIAVPITQAVYTILHQNIEPKNVVSLLLQREIKEEHL